MCPACIATMALTFAGVTSAGGLTLFIAKKVRSKGTAKGITHNQNQKRNSS